MGMALTAPIGQAERSAAQLIVAGGSMANWSVRRTGARASDIRFM